MFSGSEDSQALTSTAPQHLQSDSYHQETLLSFWPVAKLPTTFTYGKDKDGKDQQYTYEPAKYGGPVHVLLNSKEAEAASKDVSVTSFVL